MKRLIGILFLLFLITSCNENIQSESLIGKKIERECNGEGICKVNMRNLVSVGWDKMYVFKMQVSLEEINQILGFEYPYFEDIGNRIIFVKDNEVVFHEDEFPAAESAKNGEVIFNIGDSNTFRVYSPTEAVFYAEKIKFSEGRYYKLTQTK